MAKEIENIDKKIQDEEKQKQLNRIKADKIKDSIINFLGIALYVAFAIGLLAICVFIIVCIVLYALGNSFATIVLTILQVLTGIVSLVIGIWGLYLTIKANRSYSTSTTTNVSYSSVNSNVKTKQHEDDVNQSSL